MDRSEYELKRHAILANLSISKSRPFQFQYKKQLLKLINERYPDMRPGGPERLLESYIKNFHSREQDNPKERRLHGLQEEVTILQQHTKPLMERVDREQGESSYSWLSTLPDWGLLFDTPDSSALLTYAIGRLSLKLEDRIEVRVQEQQGWFRKRIVQKHVCTLVTYRKGDYNTFLRVLRPEEESHYVDILFSNPEGLIGIVQSWGFSDNRRLDHDWVTSWEQYIRSECAFIEQPGKLFKNPVSDIRGS